MGTSYPHHSSRESVGASLPWTEDGAAIQCGGAGDEGKATRGTEDREEQIKNQKSCNQKSCNQFNWTYNVFQVVITLYGHIGSYFLD